MANPKFDGRYDDQHPYDFGVSSAAGHLAIFDMLGFNRIIPPQFKNDATSHMSIMGPVMAHRIEWAQNKNYDDVGGNKTGHLIPVRYERQIDQFLQQRYRRDHLSDAYTFMKAPSQGPAPTRYVRGKRPPIKPVYRT
jgi:hypothetical protein